MDDHIKQLLLLGREHFAKREYDKAEPMLRQVAKHTDRYADVFDMLGVMAHNEGSFTLARDWFERALVLNPNYTEAQLNLMVTLNDLGDYAESRKLHGQLKKRGGQREAADAFVKGRIANMHAEISQAYTDVGMQVEAVHELEKAVSLCPNFPDLRTRLGVQYRDAGDRVRALEQFEKAKADNPEYLQARLMLGVLHLSSGDNEAAEKEFAAVLDRDPGNTGARMYRRIARGQGREGAGLSTRPPPPSEGAGPISQ